MQKSFEHLIEYIKNNTSPDFDELLEKAKNERKKLNKVFFCFAIIIDIAIFYMFSHLLDMYSFQILSVIFPIIIVDLLLYIILSLFFTKNKKAYIASFKENVIQKLLNNFYENVDYIPNKPMSRDLYDLAKYNEHYNRYYSDDYMEASIDNKYPIRMAEVHTVDVETYNSLSDTNKEKCYSAIVTITQEQIMNTFVICFFLFCPPHIRRYLTALNFPSRCTATAASRRICLLSSSVRPSSMTAV